MTHKIQQFKLFFPMRFLLINTFQIHRLYTFLPQIIHNGKSIELVPVLPPITKILNLRLKRIRMIALFVTGLDINLFYIDFRE